MFSVLSAERGCRVCGLLWVQHSVSCLFNMVHCLWSKGFKVCVKEVQSLWLGGSKCMVEGFKVCVIQNLWQEVQSLG